MVLLSVEHSGSTVSDHLTVSICMTSTTPTRDAAPEDLVGRADAALYTAKRDGRDRVVAI